MIRFTSVLIASVFFALSATAQNCNLPAGTLGLGNYCAPRGDLVLAMVSTSPDDRAWHTNPSQATQQTTQSASAQSTEQTTGQVTPVVIPGAHQQAEASPATATAPAPTPPAPALSWNITSTDQTVSVALARWASSSGWQLAWQAPRDLPAFRVSYRGSFEEAVESLMRDSQNSDYPLHACLYENKVVRVLHVTQTCAR